MNANNMTKEKSQNAGRQVDREPVVKTNLQKNQSPAGYIFTVEIADSQDNSGQPKPKVPTGAIPCVNLV
jgi:hypothetical protein